MTKKGYTLIELSISMAIVLIIFSLSFFGYKSYKNIYNEIQINQSLYEIEDLLSYGEMYCRNNGKEAIFKVYENEEGLVLELKERAGCILRKSELANVIKLQEGSANSRTLNINSKGQIQADTIKFQGQDEKIYKLTIRVSVNLITIWEWDTVYEQKRG